MKNRRADALISAKLREGVLGDPKAAVAATRIARAHGYRQIFSRSGAAERAGEWRMQNMSTGKEVRISNAGSWEHVARDQQSVLGNGKSADDLDTHLKRAKLRENAGDDHRERIQAAIITHRGETHTGTAHEFAYAKAAKKHGLPIERVKTEAGVGFPGGNSERFATTRGRHVDRHEAFAIAHAAGQLKPSYAGFEPGEHAELGSFMINSDDPHYNGKRPALWDKKIDPNWASRRRNSTAAYLRPRPR